MTATKRVLLTGATGFIGRHAIEPLMNRGFEIHAVSSRPNESAQSCPTVIWHCADLLEPRVPAELVAAVKPTHCLHFAWYAVHGKFWTSAENAKWVEASLRLLRELSRIGCKRVVVSGTCAEYDWRYGWCDEELTPLNPATFYGVCKNALRSIAAAYCAKEGVSLAWGRIFLLYGPDEAPQRLVPSVIRASLSGAVPLCSHGRQIRDFLHVRDVAVAFAALLDSAVEGAVNIGSGKPIALRDVVRKILELSGGGDANFGGIPAAPNDPPLIVPRIDRLRDEVGWSPSIGLEEGLGETIDSLRSAVAKKGII